MSVLAGRRLRAAAGAGRPLADDAEAVAGLVLGPHRLGDRLLRKDGMNRASSGPARDR